MLISPLISAVLAWGAPVMLVLGQDGVDPAQDRPRWVAVVIALLIAICVILASIKSSKRTHQD